VRGPITAFEEVFTRARNVATPNEYVEIAAGAKREITVQAFSHRWPFVRQRSDAGLPQIGKYPSELRTCAQHAMCILTEIARKGLPKNLWKSAATSRVEMPMQKWQQAVPPRAACKVIPV
jgi:hypothetical protein